MKRSLYSPVVASTERVGRDIQRDIAYHNITHYHIIVSFLMCLNKTFLDILNKVMNVIS